MNGTLGPAVLMHDPFVIESPTASDDYGQTTTYGAARNYVGLVTFALHPIRSSEGVDVTSQAYVNAMEPVQVAPTDRVTLSDGSQFAILAIERFDDGFGHPHNVVIHV